MGLCGVARGIVRVLRVVKGLLRLLNKLFRGFSKFGVVQGLIRV